MNNDDDRWLEIAGLILDGKPVVWDTIPSDRPPDDVTADALRVIADVADLHRAPAGKSVRQWGTLGIQEQIGRGSFGDVYRARDAALDRDVALKLVDYTSSTAPDEGRLLARVRHSNVVTVHGAAIHDGRYGIWMEFIRGRTLAAVVRECGPLAVEEVTAIGVDVCRALTAVHESGLLHGDIKPQNVMREEGGRIVVMDFGTGRVVKDGAAGDRLAGTPLYLAPEVLTGAAPDVRADVYSAGVLLYYLLTGAHPVEGSTLDEVRAAHASGARTPVRSRRPEIPRPLAAVIERAIAVEPSDRLESAAAFECELRNSFAKRSRAYSKRRTALIGGGVGVVLLVGVFALRTFRPDLWTEPPIAPTHRQITFVGDAAFPTISRDGKFLAYIRYPTARPHQQLIVQDLSGGPPLQVFEGPSLQAPVWSTDAAELLIASGSGLRIVPRLGGPARSVGLQLNGQSWSPDNSRFAGVNPGVKQIVIVDKKTGGVTNIPINGSFASVQSVDWSPSGDLLLFQTADDQERHTIWTIRVDGSGQEKLIEDETPASFSQPCPRWSPTGTAIYYLSGIHTKQLLKLAVSPRTGKATSSPHAVLTGLQAGPTFTISDDGRQLAYTRVGVSATLWLASTKLSAAGEDVRQLTSSTSVDALPSISPDERYVAFSRGDTENSTNVFVMPIEGGPPQQITSSSNSANLGAVWSPDGRTIAFGSTDGRVWQVSATGGTPRPFDQTRINTNRWGLAWAPGSRILYQEPDNSNFQVLNPVTGEHRPLADSSGWMEGAHTSPDGNQVAVSWNRGGSIGLWVIPIQRSSEKRLLALGRGGFGTISQSVDASPLRGRDVTLVAHVRTNVSGPGNQAQCWLRVDRPNGKVGFFDNMQDRPVQSTVWTAVRIAGKVDHDAERVAFGCLLSGTGQIWVDDIQLQRRNPRAQWENVLINNPGFEESDHLKGPVGWKAVSPGYDFQITDVTPYQGQRSLVITSDAHVNTQFVPVGWSSDGKYVYAIESHRQNEVVMIRTDGGPIRPLIDLPVPEGLSTNGNVAITPDGRRIVYSVWQTQSDVWIVQNFDSAR